MSDERAPRAAGPAAFPRLRWAALLWLAVWTPAYAYGYGWANFLHLCDLAVILTCVGLWLGSPLLLSTQAVSSLVVHLIWDVDVAWRLVSGHHLLGGTEYMWEARFPLALRLLSLFHLAWPPLLWWALRRVGYDRRALLAQTALALVVLAASRLVMPEVNINFAHRDPVWHRAWGPAVSHLAFMAAGLFVVLYAPVDLLLRRVMPRPRAEPGMGRG